MSLAGYFSKPSRPELRMPRQTAALGILFRGPATEGEKSVRECLRDAALVVPPAGGPVCQTLDDYDAVLRAHCRT